MTEIPVIDFGEMDLAVSRKMHKAFTTVGFAVFTNVYDRWLTDFDIWSDLVKQFFDLPKETKDKYKYSGVQQNLGYSEMGSEWLHPIRCYPPPHHCICAALVAVCDFVALLYDELQRWMPWLEYL